MHGKSFALLSTLAFVLSVNAHSLILSATGANGVTGSGFGVVATTPRNGRAQQDTTIIRGNNNGPCGRTRNGVNDVTENLAASIAAGLPSADTDGSVTMTLHQVNADGAGPFTCEVSADGTGATFQEMEVTTQVPGNNGRSRARGQDFPLVAQLPAGTTCTGGSTGDACLVRCTQRSGFGGCVAVTNTGAAGGGNGTDSNTGTGGANGNGNGNNGNVDNGNGNANNGTNTDNSNTGNEDGANSGTGNANSGGNSTGRRNRNQNNAGGNAGTGDNTDTAATAEGDLFGSIVSRIRGRSAEADADAKRIAIHSIAGRVTRSRIARGIKVDVEA